MAGESPVSSGVPVWNPDGDLVSIPALDQSALMQGYRAASPEEVHQAQLEAQYGGVGQGAAAFAEGAGSALTFGVSPKLEVASGLTTKEGIEGRQEVHPVAHGLGTALGVIAPLVATSGAEAPGAAAALGRSAARFTAPALISRAGHAAEHLVEGAGLPGTFGRIAPAAALGATEGALYGGSDLTEKALLGDPALTWEKAATELGIGALFGGTLAAGGKTLGELIPSGLGEGMSDWLGKTEANRNFKAVGGIQSDYNRLLKTKSKEQLEGIFREFGDRGLVTPLTTPEKVMPIARALSRQGRQDALELARAADAVPNSPRWTWTDLRGEIEPEIAGDLRSKGATYKAAQLLEAKLDDYSAAYADRLLNVSDLYDLRIDIDHSIYQYGKSLDPFVKPVARPLKQIRDFLADKLESAMNETGVGAEAWQEALRKQEVGLTAASIAKKGILRDVGNNPIPLTTLIGAVAGGSAFASPAGAVLSGTGAYLARRYASGTIGSAAGGLRRLLERGGSEEAVATLTKMGGEGGGGGGGGGASLSDLFQRVRSPDGGFTYNPTLRTEPTEGYALSIHPERSSVFAADQVKLKDLAEYVTKNRDLLSKEGNHFGAWHDPATGQVFLDVSTVTNDEKLAARLARDHDQIAYFDLKRGQSVPVGKGGVHAEQAESASLGSLGRSGEGPGAAGSALQEAHRQDADRAGAGGGAGSDEEVRTGLAGALSGELGSHHNIPERGAVGLAREVEEAADKRLSKRVGEKTYGYAKDKAQDELQNTAKEVLGTPEDFGAETRVITPNNPGGEPARYALVEAKKLIPSHDPQTFKPNPKYPDGVQERAYASDKLEQMKVVNGAKELKPSLLLTDTPTPVDGPPLVAAGKHYVLGGNSRVMMILRAEKATFERYREALKEKIHQFGLKPEHVEKYDSPVLVRVLPQVSSSSTPPQLTAAVRRFNEGMTQGMSPAARSVAEARAMSPQTMDSMSGLLASNPESSLRELMRDRPQEFIGPLQRDGIISTTKGSEFVAGGELTAEGKDRIEGMFLGRVMGTGDRLDTTAPATRAKVERTVPYLLAVAQINPEADEIGTMREALDLLSDAKRRGLTLQDSLAQRPMFGEGAPNPRAEAMAGLLAELGPRAVGERFGRWAQAAAVDPRQMAMFGATTTPEQLDAILFGGMPGQPMAAATTGAQQRIIALSKAADRKLKSATGGILEDEAAGGEKFARGGMVTPENFTDVSSALRSYGGDLDRLAEDVSHQTAPLHDHAPATTAAAHAFAARVVAHLAPRLPDSGPRQLLDAQFEPSATELASYNRHHEVANRGPVAVLEHLARGTLHPDHVEASQAIYPRLHQVAQQAVTEKLAEHIAKKERIPIHLRSSLSLFLGTDLEHAQTPGAVLSAQLAHQPAVAAPPPPAQASRPRNVETEFGQRTATASQGNETRMRKA